MRNCIYILALLLLVFGCGGNQQENATEKIEDSTELDASAVKSLENLTELDDVTTRGIYRTLVAGDPSKVEKSLKGLRDVNIRDKQGNTLLHFAAREIEYGVAKLLIEWGADVNATNKWGFTPLHSVRRPVFEAPRTAEPAIKIIRFLLDNGTDINAKNDDGETPLFWIAARFSESPEVVELLIDSGALINSRNKHGATPLHEAAKQDSLAVAKTLITAGADINAQDNDGHTPLDLAKTEEMKQLLRKQ